MNPMQEVIDLDTSSDEELLADAKGLENVALPCNRSPFVDLDGDPIMQVEIDPAVALRLCLQEVTEVFPDISIDYLRQLYEDHVNSNGLSSADGIGISQRLTEQILDSKNYPKEQDQKNEANQLKRKRDSQNSDDGEANRWKNANLKSTVPDYTKICQRALQEDFPLVPVNYINMQLKDHGNFYGAHTAIAKAEREYDDVAQKPYATLKYRRYSTQHDSETLMLQLKNRGIQIDELKLEIVASRQRRKRDDGKRTEQARAAADIVAKEQAERQNGDIMECACCFDEAPISKITHCNGEMPHFFCFDCARMNADNDIGVNKYGLQCMDGSVCKSTFSRAERAKFLDAKTIEKLEMLEQQAAIRAAMEDLPDFVTCPFCQYGAICPPLEIDKEFRCGSEECKEISCRLCKERSHIPLSCEEHKKENGLSERHVIEEARTEALVRTCPKCKVRIIKEDGCNKVVCTTCSTASRYGHFEGQAPATGNAGRGDKRCPLYDPSGTHKDERVAEAGKAALEKVRMENPDLSEEDLRIKFSKEVEAQQDAGKHYPYFPPYRHPNGHALPRAVAFEALQPRVFARRHALGGNPYFDAGVMAGDAWARPMAAHQPLNPQERPPLPNLDQVPLGGEDTIGNPVHPQVHPPLNLGRARPFAQLPNLDELQQRLDRARDRIRVQMPPAPELQGRTDQEARRQARLRELQNPFPRYHPQAPELLGQPRRNGHDRLEGAFKAEPEAWLHERLRGHRRLDDNAGVLNNQDPLHPRPNGERPLRYPDHQRGQRHGQDLLADHGDDLFRIYDPNQFGAAAVEYDPRNDYGFGRRQREGGDKAF